MRPAVSPLRVCVVDDDLFVRRALARLLTAARPSWAFRFAASAEEALAALEAQPADVLLTDLRMPGMGGVELLRRAAERFPRAVRVAHTAHLGDLRGNAHLTHLALEKPVPSAELLAALDDAAALAWQELAPRSGVPQDESETTKSSPA